MAAQQVIPDAAFETTLTIWRVALGLLPFPSQPTHSWIIMPTLWIATGAICPPLMWWNLLPGVMPGVWRTACARLSDSAIQAALTTASTAERPLIREAVENAARGNYVRAIAQHAFLDTFSLNGGVQHLWQLLHDNATSFGPSLQGAELLQQPDPILEAAVRLLKSANLCYLIKLSELLVSPSKIYNTRNTVSFQKTNTSYTYVKILNLGMLRK